MASSSVIINHRNMTRIYSIWIILLVTLIASASLAYGLQYSTPFDTDRSFTLLYSLIGVSVVFTILGILFKWVFRREVIAWIFIEIIGQFGLVLLLLYGWHFGFIGFYIASLILLLSLGPYLHFE